MRNAACESRENTWLSSGMPNQYGINGGVMLRMEETARAGGATKEIRPPCPPNSSIQEKAKVEVTQIGQPRPSLKLPPLQDQPFCGYRRLNCTNLHLFPALPQFWTHLLLFCFVIRYLKVFGQDPTDRDKTRNHHSVWLKVQIHIETNNIASRRQILPQNAREMSQLELGPAKRRATKELGTFSAAFRHLNSMR